MEYIEYLIFMSIKITKECINCGACEEECPNHAIYEGGKKWRMTDGTNIKKSIINKMGYSIYKQPKKKDIYFIISEKCTECIGFYDRPQCIDICPVKCCIYDNANKETKENLLKKKSFLHHNDAK